MGRINRWVAFYVNHRAVLALLLLLAALEVLFLLRVLWPAALEFIVEHHVFEIVVLLSIAQIMLLLMKLLDRSPRQICEDEHDCEALLREVVRKDLRARSLHVLSAGLGSRLDLLTSIHRVTSRELAVEVLAQDPKVAPDRHDAERMESLLKILDRDHRVKLEGRLFTTPASIRALVLCDQNRSPFWGAVSWYRYQTLEDGGVRVVGRSNPALVLQADRAQEDAAILEFVMKVFDESWAASANAVFYSYRAPTDAPTTEDA